MLVEKSKYGKRVLMIGALIFAVLLGYALNAQQTHALEGQVSAQSMDLLTKIGEAQAEVAAAVKPAIVNISTSRTMKISGGMDPFSEDPFFKRFFGDRFHMPKERKSAGLASGVIVSSDGYIITNYHVVKDADEIKVTLADKREFVGKVVGSDPKTEVSVVKIDAKGLPVLEWGDSDALKVGDVVLAVGNPYGLNQTVTMGIVSAVGRANVGIADYEDFIQTDAAINPGNSGGALVNVKGQLVGINTAIFSTSGGYQGIGFAIPSNMIKTIMESLVKKGKVVRGWLGVSIQKITPELAKEFKLKSDAGSLVSDVVDGGAADKAGLKRGDVITEYDGKKIDEPTLLRNAVAGSLPGEEHTLTLVREGKTMKVTVKVGEQPGEVQTSAVESVLKGVSVQDITPELSNRLSIPDKIKGVIVSDVDEQSPAAGVLQEGDVIREVNRTKVANVKEYREAAGKLSKSDVVLLLIYRQGSSVFITLSSK